MKKYDENSPDYQCLSDTRTCMLEQIAYGGRDIWDEKATEERFRRISEVCRTFLDRLPPMFSDTFLRAEKLIDLCEGHSVFDCQTRFRYITQECLLFAEELAELMEGYRIRGPFGRTFVRIRNAIHPPFIEMKNGIRYRKNRELAKAMHEAYRITKTNRK